MIWSVTLRWKPSWPVVLGFARDARWKGKQTPMVSIVTEISLL